MRQKTQLWWKEWIKLFVPAQVCWKKFSKLYVAKEYLFISALSWSLAALVSNGKESGNWIKMVMIPVYLGNPLSLKTNPSPLLPLIYAGPPGLVKREEEIMHTCHDTGNQYLPPTPLLPILENIFLHKTLLDKHRFDIHTHSHTNIHSTFIHFHFSTQKPRLEFVNWKPTSLLLYWSFGIQALPDISGSLFFNVNRDCPRVQIMR